MELVVPKDGVEDANWNVEGACDGGANWKPPAEPLPNAGGEETNWKVVSAAGGAKEKGCCMFVAN